MPEMKFIPVKYVAGVLCEFRDARYFISTNRCKISRQTIENYRVNISHISGDLAKIELLLFFSLFLFLSLFSTKQIFIVEATRRIIFVISRTCESFSSILIPSWNNRPLTEHTPEFRKKSGRYFISRRLSGTTFREECMNIVNFYVQFN